MKSLVNISGGAIKFIALITAFKELLSRDINPKVVSGVSSGAIITFLYACGRIEEGLELARGSHDIRMIFSWKNQPTGKLGGFSITAIWKILRGKNYIGIMDNLEKNIRKITSQKDFETYKHDSATPDCYVLGIDKYSGAHIIENLKTLDYNQAIDLVIGSSNIAPTTPFRKFLNHTIADGGHRGHSAGAFLLRKNIDSIKSKIDHCFTIFSRPEPNVYEEQPLGPMNNFFERLLNFTIGVSIKETSLNDEYVERTESEASGMPYIPIYIRKFTKDTYTISENEIAIGENIGKKAVKRYYK